MDLTAKYMAVLNMGRIGDEIDEKKFVEEMYEVSEENVDGKKVDVLALDTSN